MRFLFFDLLIFFKSIIIKILFICFLDLNHFLIFKIFFSKILNHPSRLFIIYLKALYFYHTILTTHLYIFQYIKLSYLFFKFIHFLICLFPISIMLIYHCSCVYIYIFLYYIIIKNFVIT